MATVLGYTYELKYRIVRKDGSIRWVQEIIQNICNSSGKVAFVQGAIYDITRNKKLKEQLIHSEKLSAVGQLAAGIAHEFNNILAIINGKVEVLLFKQLKDIIELPEIAIGVLRVIEEQVDRGKELVSNMLAFSKPQKPKKLMYYIEDIMDKVFKLQSSQLELENIEVIRNYSAERKAVYVDYGQMQQVFLNLSMNAMHAIKLKGGGK